MRNCFSFRCCLKLIWEVLTTIFKINPIKDISKLSFYFDDHYLGKDKARNVFIRSADNLYKTEVILDGKVVEASWQKQIQLIKRKKAHIVYRLTEKSEGFLKAAYDNFGIFNLSIIEEL